MDNVNGFQHGPKSSRAQARGERSGQMAACGIAIMAKASIPGRTKTRLSPPLTLDEAASFNTAFLQDVVENLSLASRHASIATYVAFGPPGSEPFFRSTLPPEVGLLEVWLPNFGDCLFSTIESLFTHGHDSAIVLNSDSPTLPTAFLIEAARSLARPGDRAVLGPSSDGGYYLLGLKAAHRRMFEDIAWSTDRVAAQTRERARKIGLKMEYLPTWYDVDDVEGLRTLHDELLRPSPARSKLLSHHARHSGSLMRRLCDQSDLGKRIEQMAHVTMRPQRMRA